MTSMAITTYVLIVKPLTDKLGLNGVRRLRTMLKYVRQSTRIKCESAIKTHLRSGHGAGLNHRGRTCEKEEKMRLAKLESGQKLQVTAIIGSGEGPCVFCGQEVWPGAPQRTSFRLVLPDSTEPAWVCDMCMRAGQEGIRARALNAADQQLIHAHEQLETARILQHLEIEMPTVQDQVDVSCAEFERLCDIAGVSPKHVLDNKWEGPF